MCNCTLPLVLGYGDAPTSATATVVRPIRSSDGVSCVEWMTMLAVRLSRVHFEVGARRVMHVLRVRNKFQMVGPDATRGHTDVVDLKARRDVSPDEGVSQTVSKPVSSTNTGCSEYSVSRWQLVSLPKPTLPALINLCPKPLLKRADYLFGALIGKRVAMTLPAPIVHLAPTTLLGGLQTAFNGAIHV